MIFSHKVIMNRTFNLIFLLISYSLTSQYLNEYNSIETDCQEFKNTITKYKLAPSKKLIEHFSEFPSLHFKTALNGTFGIETFTENNPKLEAAIIHTISNSTKYEYLADLFDKNANKKRFVFKELLKLEITTLPDTSNFIKTKQQKINNLETIIQYNFQGTIVLKKPIQVVYFSSTQETNNSIEKVSKIKITQKNNVLYESVRKDKTLMIQDAQNKTNIESHLFTYLNDQNCLEIQGGLWNYLLDKKLK